VGLELILAAFVGLVLELTTLLDPFIFFIAY
jgi:hypothetical protein